MSPASSRARLVLRGLSHVYPRSPEHLGPRPHAVSGEVRAGEWVCVAGPNGSGKSTLLRLAAGLLRPTEGEVWIEGWGGPAGSAGPSTDSAGRAALRPGDRAFRRALGYLSQLASQQVFGSTVADELAAGLEWHGVPRPDLLQRVERALAGLGGPDWRGRTASMLSAGERRRVALAAVVLPGPSFVLADEPLADLDPFARAAWLDRLAALTASGTGVLTASTSACEAARADRVWLLEPGRPGAREVPPASLLDPAVARAAGLRPVPPGNLGFEDLGRAAAVCAPGAPGARAALVAARVRRGGACLWESLDLGAPERGLAALFARNGAGKTSLAMVLAGLRRPEGTPGPGAPGGAPAAGPDNLSTTRGLGWTGPPGRRRCLSALAFQSPEDQLGQATVREELIPPRGFAGCATAPGELLEAVGLPPADFLGRSPQELSAGERRRVALAALAALDPGLLVLDEPLGGLDGPGVERVAGWILGQAAARTVWVLSSDLDAPEIPVAAWLGLRRGGAPETDLELPPGTGLSGYLPWAFGAYCLSRRGADSTAPPPGPPEVD